MSGFGLTPDQVLGLNTALRDQAMDPLRAKAAEVDIAYKQGLLDEMERRATAPRSELVEAPDGSTQLVTVNPDGTLGEPQQVFGPGEENKRMVSTFDMVEGDTLYKAGIVYDPDTDDFYIQRFDESGSTILASTSEGYTLSDLIDIAAKVSGIADDEAAPLLKEAEVADAEAERLRSQLPGDMQIAYSAALSSGDPVALMIQAEEQSPEVAARRYADVKAQALEERATSLREQAREYGKGEALDFISGLDGSTGQPEAKEGVAPTAEAPNPPASAVDSSALELLKIADETNGTQVIDIPRIFGLK